ncbi:DNA-binding response regulator [Paenibacillus psychroresistens]|uniref:DNA-binding response regulator n=1 Tax=Paenibacillus psychroresistens TaxID=1778678 RepID=A0A6B8RSC3_9BACL|nr:LuxR C-terminal-related transcriptional regulator [Paenibacillus psychroresistens]QGQ99310.1 DNA-binding response regulator [Paenibacillus psychroresistens]
MNTVTSLTSLKDASTYASAIAKQLQGLIHADTDIAQAKQYFEEAADAFVELHLPLDVARSRLGWAMLDSIQRPVVAVQAMKQCLDIFSQFDDSSYTFFTNSLSGQIQSIEVPQEHPIISNGEKILTNREWEVASQVAKGISNAEIASNLSLSVRTITTHLERIYSKLALRSRSALFRYMFERREN